MEYLYIYLLVGLIVGAWTCNNEYESNGEISLGFIIGFCALCLIIGFPIAVFIILRKLSKIKFKKKK
jgi:TRAP-type C4-dicarboxylate transport system permease small subunit